MVELHKATIKQLRELLDQKKISAVELTDYFLDRIDRLDGTLNSFITVCADQAREQAKAAQLLIDRSSVRAWTGIPVALKDNLCTEGVLTTCGSKMLANFTPPYDATVAKKLKGYGAVLIGKTNLDEFDLGSTTQTSHFGGTNNPYGASKGADGSAVCVAAGLVPVALGSDSGGTLCQPAAFCGITGLRPTYGCVSRYGLVASTSSMDQIGPLAKSAVDCAVMMDAITDYDPNDATMSQPNCFDYSQHIGKPLSGMTVGLLTIEDTAPQVLQAVLTAADAYRQMGCTVKEVSLPSQQYAAAAYTVLSSAEVASNLARYDGIRFGYRSQKAEDYEQLVKNTRGEGFGSEAKSRILLGTYLLSKGSYEIYYRKALLLRQQIKQEYAVLFENCDFIITPTMAYPVGNHPTRYQTDVYSAAVSLAGLPALTTPCGYDQQGMPIGMTLVGRPFDEATILGAAAAFESGFARREVS